MKPMDNESEEQYAARIHHKGYDEYVISEARARVIAREHFLLKAINEAKCVSNLQPVLRRIVTGE